MLTVQSSKSILAIICFYHVKDGQSHSHEIVHEYMQVMW